MSFSPVYYKTYLVVWYQKDIANKHDKAYVLQKEI